jgi:hypothetical protein
MKIPMKLFIAAALASCSISLAFADSTMPASHHGKHARRMNHPISAEQDYAKAPAMMKPFSADEQREFDRLTGNVANF